MGNFAGAVNRGKRCRRAASPFVVGQSLSKAGYPGRMVSVKAVRRVAARLLSDSRGATAVEYGLIIAMVVLAMLVALNSVANVTIGMWGNVSTRVVNAR